MQSLLIVSNTRDTLEIISDLLKILDFDRIVISQNETEARRELQDGDFDFIFVDVPPPDVSGNDVPPPRVSGNDAPLPDSFGDTLALYCAKVSRAVIVLIAAADDAPLLSARVENDGIFVLPKPIRPEYFSHMVKLLSSVRKRMLKLESENEKLLQTLDDVRIIDRAKFTLMQYLNMSESQAHKYIEKQSMDLRQNKTVTAENILKTYES
ncbi:MAG: hypothetical protein Ta2A_06040 [Treponemataceae bacterium]|nr:MAG: hypothetical protein Ta2A_06040 [Treponemataceae bacterium]